MLTQSRALSYLSHAGLICAVGLMVFPLYIAFVASTHDASALLRAPIPWLPGSYFIENYQKVLFEGVGATGSNPIWLMLLNSFVLAITIAVGKISISILSAYAIVFYRFPLRKLCFWLIFATLMFPIEVRILPTFQVIADLNMLNRFPALCLPVIASATATFLFRQFFMTIPNTMADAAKIDGADGWRFFIHIVLPLSKSNIAALFIIMFVYGWNQYLWPLVIISDVENSTILMGLQQMMSVADQLPQWHYAMTMAVLALLPPVVTVVFMQRLFEKGLVYR